MIKSIPIRWRLTLLSTLLLTLCCIGLTLVLNFSAFKLIDKIDAAVLTTPMEIIDIGINDNVGSEQIPLTPIFNTTAEKKIFSNQSIIYMLFIILGGSALTYYVSKKALEPLNNLNNQVKKTTVNNLHETITLPKTKDEIYDLSISYNEMTNQLDEIFVAQKRFSANAAHELRTPLAILQTKLDVFNKKKNRKKEEYVAIIDIFEKQTKRLRDLISVLLEMNSNVESEKQEINLKDVLEDVVSELTVLASNKNIKLKLNCEDSLVLGHSDLLYRAFYNVVENGIKYNIKGGQVSITSKRQKDGKIEVGIKDTGLGISDDDKKHIFEPFYRVDKSRSRELGGSGLGLALVNDIINKHNGHIEVFDNKKKGTYFKIVF